MSRLQTFAFRFVLRVFALVLCLLCAVPASTQSRPSIDLEVPSYPLEAAACAAIQKGGVGTVEDDPYKISGLVPEKGMQISGFMVPDTPIFRFYASILWNVLSSPVVFDPKVRCFINATLSQDGKIRYQHIPNGNYLVFTTTIVHVAYQSSSPSVGFGMSPEGPVVVTGGTTTQNVQYDRMHVYMAPLKMRPSGVTAEEQVEIARMGK